MKKGITPVIAMILLILIVVALGGIFAAWTTRTWQTVQESGSEQITHISGEMQKSLTIDNVNCDNKIIYIKNTGTADITVDEIGIYVGDVLYTNETSGVVFDPNDTLQSNKILTVNMTGISEDFDGKKIKVSVGAGIQDSSNKCE